MTQWTTQDLETVRTLYPHTKTATIAAMLGRPIGQVYQKAAALGLKKGDAYLASQDACRLRRGGDPGAATRFKPGHATWNKGMKGLNIGGKDTQLRALKDKTAPMEIERARAVSEIAQTIINSAKVEIEHMKVTDARRGTGFLPDPEKPGVTLTASGIKTVTSLPGGNVTEHRMRG